MKQKAKPIRASSVFPTWRISKRLNSGTAINKPATRFSTRPKRNRVFCELAKSLQRPCDQANPNQSFENNLRHNVGDAAIKKALSSTNIKGIMYRTDPIRMALIPIHGACLSNRSSRISSKSYGRGNVRKHRPIQNKQMHSQRIQTLQPMPEPRHLKRYRPR